MERRLAAIMATDVVGYSRLVRENEGETLRELKADRLGIVEPKISEHGGRIFKLVGDGLLAEFPSAVAAVQCAVEVQQLLADERRSVSAAMDIQYRIGINIGDVVVDDDDIYGDGVNLSARLEKMAEPGGVCISRNVFNQVKDKLDLTFENVGDHQLKNITEPMTVYKISFDKKSAALVTPVRIPSHRPAKRWVPIAAVAIVCIIAVSVGPIWWAQSPQTGSTTDVRAPEIGKSSIAVLSFDTFSPKEEERFLAEGLAEDIINQLARGNELQVMARTSTFELKDQGLNALEVAEQLGVEYVLEGSVRRFDDKLRITTQLIDASAGDNIWAERYDATASEIYVTQDDIVGRIVGTLSSEIRETDKAEVLRRPPADLDVYELTLRGLARKHRLNPEDMALARQDLRRAVEMDPNYAPAWLYLGWVEAIAIVFKWVDDTDFPTLEESIQKVEKSIALEPTLATAYQALGLLKAYAGDANGALQAATRSVELGPGDADNLLFFGRALASVGRFDEAVSASQRAVALNPVRPSYYDYYMSRSMWGVGEYEQANLDAADCLTKAPGFTACRVVQVASYSGMAQTDEASDAVLNLLQLTPNFTIADALRSVGFPGDPIANERLSNHLAEAGLPSGEK